MSGGSVGRDGHGAAAVFPIGQYAGTVDAQSSHPDNHVVRVGRAMEQLDDGDFGVWVLAHGTVEIGKGCWSREHVVERASGSDIADAGARFDALLARGLLAVAPAGADGAVAFATAYQMRAMLVGLGTLPDAPEQHAVGVPGVGTAALLDPSSYRCWQWATVEPSLWQLCRRRGDAARGAALEALVDPAQALRELLGELRVLLAHGCVYLDAVLGPAATRSVSG